eukprot:1141436-Pelagomonas_calceolata.AAC.1
MAASRMCSACWSCGSKASSSAVCSSHRWHSCCAHATVPSSTPAASACALRSAIWKAASDVCVLSCCASRA